MIYTANSQEWVSTQNINKGPVRVKEGNQMKRPKYFWNEIMGKRFKLFRQLVEKSRREMASELNQTPDYISGIEEGNVLPTIDEILKLYISYGLNGSWLYFGNVNIFRDKGPKTPDHAFIIGMLAQYEGMEAYIPCKKKQLPAELQEIIGKIQHFIKNKQQLPGNQSGMKHRTMGK
jgi:transcriptional regulator with XRE-family HTH domain